MSERKSKHAGWKQHVCDQLARMREDGEATLVDGFARHVIVPVAGVVEDDSSVIVVVRCKRGYELAYVSGKDSGSRLRATTRHGDTFWISPRDVLAVVKRTI